MPNNIARSSITTSGVSISSALLNMSSALAANVTVLTFAFTVTGTATFTLSYSYQPVTNPANVSRWIPFSEANGLTQSDMPVDFQTSRQITAIQLNQTSGSGSVVVDITYEFRS